MGSLTMLVMMMMAVVEVVRGEKCHHPPPAPGYTNTLYAGRWYEVGKYQTLGGAIFQQDTVCTIATFLPYNMAEGGGDIGEIIYYISSLASTSPSQYCRIFQSEARALGVLVQRYGKPGTNGAPGSFLSNSQLWGIRGSSSGLQCGLAG